MKLVIDCREHKIKEILSNNGDIPFTIEQLDLGDIIFKANTEDNNNEFICLIIERKTISDLYSSIRDGRHKEQKARLLSNYSPNSIYYIIEGSISRSDQRYNIITGAILNTILRDKINIIRTKDIQETIYYLVKMYSKLLNNPNWNNSLQLPNTNSNSLDQYSNTIKTKKKENLTPRVCQIVQLSQIPGMSHTTAKILLNKYSSLSNIILEYYKLGEDFESKNGMLENIELTTSTGKKRKFGKVLSNRVYEYLCSNEIME